MIMKNNILLYVFGSILLVIIILILFSVNKTNFDADILLPEPFVFNDSSMLRILSIIPYEYLKIEGFRPDNIVLVGSKGYVEDEFHCEMINGFAIKYVNKSIRCIVPYYWKDYAYDYENGIVMIGFRVFEDNVTANEYVDQQLVTFLNISVVNNIFGYVIESRVIITPTEIGRMIDRIEFIEVIDSSMVNPNMLISLIRADNIVYIIFEESESTIRNRQYLYAFTEEYHEAAIRILEVPLLI